MGNRLIPRRDEVLFPVEKLINKLYDDFLSDFNGVKNQKNGFPLMDVMISNDSWIVETAVAGVPKENINVEILEDDGKKVLVVSGSFEEVKGYEWHKKELSRSSFERRVMLPEHVKGEPEATLKDGILRLVWKTIPPPDTRKLIKVDVKSI